MPEKVLFSLHWFRTPLNSDDGQLEKSVSGMHYFRHFIISEMGTAHPQTNAWSFH
jgi:hypothetical protein